jgi:type I restriction enzyme S subunit
MAAEGWRRVRLGDVVDFSSGGKTVGDRLGDGVDAPLVRTSDLSDSGNGMYVRSAIHVEGSGSNQVVRARVCPAQSVVFPKVGAALLATKCRMLASPSRVDSNLISVTAKGPVDPYFLYFWLSEYDVTPLVRGGVVPSVTQGDVADVLMDLPPMHEQRRITSVALSIDEAIEASQDIVVHQVVMLDQLRRDLLRSGVGAAVRLGDVANVSWGNASLTKSAYIKAGAIAFSAAGQDGCVSVAEHQGPGIILSAIGAQCGRCFWADGSWTAIKNTLTISEARPVLNLRYLFHLAVLPGFWQVRGGARRFICQGDARAKTIQIPSRSYQDRATAAMDLMVDAIDASRSQVESLTRMRRGILRDLTSGRVRVPTV